MMMMFVSFDDLPRINVYGCKARSVRSVWVRASSLAVNGELRSTRWLLRIEELVRLLDSLLLELVLMIVGLVLRRVILLMQVLSLSMPTGGTPDGPSGSLVESLL